MKSPACRPLYNEGLHNDECGCCTLEVVPCSRRTRMELSVESARCIRAILPHLLPHCHFSAVPPCSLALLALIMYFINVCSGEIVILSNGRATLAHKTILSVQTVQPLSARWQPSSNTKQMQPQSAKVASYSSPNTDCHMCSASATASARWHGACSPNRCATKVPGDTDASGFLSTDQYSTHTGACHR